MLRAQGLLRKGSPPCNVRGAYRPLRRWLLLLVHSRQILPNTPTTNPSQTYSCDVLNWLGGLWLALLIVGCCGVPLALAAFWWVGRMDRLEPRG